MPYADRKLRNRLMNDRRKVRNRELIISLKSKPCFDCKGEFPWWVMQFDHRPGEEKLFDMAVKARNVPTGRVRQEAEKCDVVCSNCHAHRTYMRSIGAV